MLYPYYSFIVHYRSGSKASLIGHIEHVEGNATSRRHSSTVNHPVASPSPLTLNVKLPDLSAEPELPGPQIVSTIFAHEDFFMNATQPFLPDFWDSSRVRGTDAISHEAGKEAPMRQMVMVGGSSVQHAEGLAYDLPKDSQPDDNHAEPTTATQVKKEGLWADIHADIGLPPTFGVQLPFSKTKRWIDSVFDEETTRKTSRVPWERRPLDTEERRGLWVLVLIFGSSWIAGGVFVKAKNDTS